MRKRDNAEKLEDEDKLEKFPGNLNLKQPW